MPQHTATGTVSRYLAYYWPTSFLIIRKTRHAREGLCKCLRTSERIIRAECEISSSHATGYAHNAGERLDMILRRPSAAACRPKSARRVRVGGERRVSLARHRDVGTQHLTPPPSASDKRGWGTVGAVCVHDVGMRRRCRLGRRTDVTSTKWQRPELGSVRYGRVVDLVDLARLAACPAYTTRPRSKSGTDACVGALPAGASAVARARVPCLCRVRVCAAPRPCRLPRPAPTPRRATTRLCRVVCSHGPLSEL